MHFRIAVTVHYICDNMPDKLNANSDDVAMHTSNESNMSAPINYLKKYDVFHESDISYNASFSLTYI